MDTIEEVLDLVKRLTDSIKRGHGKTAADEQALQDAERFLMDNLEALEGFYDW